LPNIPTDETFVRIDVSNLNRHDLIAYTYGLVLKEKNTDVKTSFSNYPEIRTNIEKIK
jgi:hypothetical protein